MAYTGMASPELFRQAIRNGAGVTYTVDASVGGTVVAAGLRPTGGSITDTTKPGVRRVLNLELAPSPGLYNLLSPVGLTLTATAHVTFTNRTVVDIPMGVFDADTVKTSEGGGGLSLTAPDKWVRIQRAKFGLPRQSTPGMAVVDQIEALLTEVLGPFQTIASTASSMATVGALTWEKDRDKAILDLAASIGAWVYFDRNGVPTIADIPTIGASADWLVDASAAGVLTELDRSKSRTNTYNVVIVSSSSATAAAFPAQVVWDNDPTSVTYAGPDPLNNPAAAGPFGVAPYFYDTPLPLTVDQALTTGYTILSRTTGLASQTSMGQVPNPAVDAFDVLDVVPPEERYDIARVSERQVADTVTHSFALGTAQTIDGRSTRTDDYS